MNFSEKIKTINNIIENRSQYNLDKQIVNI